MGVVQIFLKFLRFLIIYPFSDECGEEAGEGEGDKAAEQIPEHREVRQAVRLHQHSEQEGSFRREREVGVLCNISLTLRLILYSQDHLWRDEQQAGHQSGEASQTSGTTASHTQGQEGMSDIYLQDLWNIY